MKILFYDDLKKKIQLYFFKYHLSYNIIYQYLKMIHIFYPCLWIIRLYYLPFFQLNEG